MAQSNGAQRLRAEAQAGIGRRHFLRTATTAAGFFALGGPGRWGSAVAQTAMLPSPDTSGIEHIVIVMMENRSFDHFLGWIDGADGRQAGLTYVDAFGTPHRTHPLAPDYQGCGHSDPDHSYTGGRVEYNNGACDGWMRAGDNDEYAIGFYKKKDLAFLGSAATSWTTCDRFFSAIMAETFPNRIYQHAAQTDRIANTLDISTLPTIWDRLAEASLDGRYYFSDVPLLGLWGPKYLPIARPILQFFIDAQLGMLPHLAVVEPRFLGEENGVSNDDHPFADIRNGEAFMSAIYTAVTTSPTWRNTVLVFSYDEWGGFFDHVPPTRAPISSADRLAGNEDGLRGFRVPAVVVSPFARRGHVSHVELDHTSILRMVEWRWNLHPLSIRDETANNLAEVLDFGAPNLRAKPLVVPVGPFGQPCVVDVPDKWELLRVASASYGWPV